MSSIASVSRFVDQSVADLHYCVFSGMPDRHALNIIRQERISNGFLSLELSIIGESHCMSIRTGSAVLTELLACLVPGTEPIVSAVGPAIPGRDYALNFQDLRYGFAAEAIDLSGGDHGTLRRYRDFYDACRPDGIALEHSFEMPCSYEHDARTAIAVMHAPGDGFEVRTLHLYPNEARGIATRTRLARREP